MGIFGKKYQKNHKIKVFSPKFNIIFQNSIFVFTNLKKAFFLAYDMRNSTFYAFYVTRYCYFYISHFWAKMGKKCKKTHF